MLSRLRQPLDVVVESASIGWAAPGALDPRVARIAREMALPLPPVSSNCEGQGGRRAPVCDGRLVAVKTELLRSWDLITFCRLVAS